MITDIFFKRYPHLYHFGGLIPGFIERLFLQSAQIFFDDVAPLLIDLESTCTIAYKRFVREYGHGLLDGKRVSDICAKVLCERFDIWNNNHGRPEKFFLNRISLIEVLFAEAQADVKKPAPASFFTNSKGVPTDLKLERFAACVDELNYRFRESQLLLHFHNGLIQQITDDRTTNQVHEPFWRLVSERRWGNIDIDIKEAIDRRDQKGRDVALYAMKALESAIKIISDEKGWTRGNEKGAANYIDNLVSSANGRFIDVWEADSLKALFRDLRNPHGHGPGGDPQPTLSVHQETWIIDNSMSWIKSLIMRL